MNKTNKLGEIKKQKTKSSTYKPYEPSIHAKNNLNVPKSKLGLPRVTMELDNSLNQSTQGDLEKIGYTSSNGQPGNCCKILDKYLIRHLLR